MSELSVFDTLEEQYVTAENTPAIDYWTPLSKIIIESLELRDAKAMNQTELAKIMKTRQSVISRFENMGRLPNYDFIARLATALGHAPGMTLYGDYMATVPLEKQEIVKNVASERNISTQSLVQNMMEEALEVMYMKNTYKASKPFVLPSQMKMNILMDVQKGTTECQTEYQLAV